MTSLEQSSAEQTKDALHDEPLSTICVVEAIRTGQALFERAQRICQRYGLTLSTANVLAIIDGANASLSPQMIRDRLVITGGAVTQLLDYLEQRQLVRRISHPTDRRSVLIEITAAGRALRQALQPVLQQHDAAWMAGLTVGEQQHLVALLQRVQAHRATDDEATKA